MDADPIVAGRLAAAEQALPFARVVRRVHHRYAREVVAAFSLCPFLRDPESAFGRFAVMLDRELDLPAARDVALAAPGVVHLVYPLCACSSREIERFGNRLHELVRREAFARGLCAPVHATFHPQMEGDPSDGHRLVGLLRRAPDPFVQFVPEGLMKGGTQFVDPSLADLAALAAAPPPARGGLFERLSRADIETIARLQAEIRAERDASYAGFIEAF